jgi:hypothetical protein
MHAEFVGKPEGKRRLGRLKIVRKDNIKEIVCDLVGGLILLIVTSDILL